MTKTSLLSTFPPLVRAIRPVQFKMAGIRFLLSVSALTILLSQTALAQPFSARITGPAVWQKGQTLPLTWTYTGTPPASLQAGVQVRAISLAGTSTNYTFTQSVVFAAKATQVPAMNFTYTQNTAAVIVLTDMLGNQVTPPFNVVITIPPPYNFQLQITGAPIFAAGHPAGPVQWTYSGTPPASLTQCGVDVIYTVGGRPYQLSRANPVAGNSGTTGTIGFPVGTTGVITLADACSGQNLTPQGVNDTVQAASTTPVTPPAPPPTAVSGDPTLARAACNYILGRDCTASENAALIQPGRQGPMFTTRLAMQAYLINYIGVTGTVKSAVIQLAVTNVYGARAVCTEAITALNSSFTGDPNSTAPSFWNGYAQLVTATASGPALLAATVTRTCGSNAPSAPGQTGSPADISTACQWAFGPGGCGATNYALANYPNLTGMEQALANAIKASPSLTTNLATAAYTAGTGKAPCTAAVTDLVARFNSNSVSSPQPLVSWAGYAQLVAASNGQTLVGNETAKCVAPKPVPPPPNTPAGPISANTALMNAISQAYMDDFGRPPTSAEMAYWGSQKTDDPRVATPAAFLQNNIAYLQANQSERQKMIQAAYLHTWPGVTLSVSSKEMTYWDPIAASGKLVCNTLKTLNDAFKAANPTYVPGQPPKTKLSTTYSLLSDDFLTLVTNLSAFLNASMVPSSPATGPLPAPPISNRPTMGSPNPTGVNSPFAIATTSDQDPSQSYCLDVTSTAAGTSAVATRCHPQTQLWVIDGNYIRLAANTSFCLDSGDKPWPVDRSHKIPVINPCYGGATQTWYTSMIPGARAGAPYTDDHWHFPPPLGQIQNISTGQCLNLQGANPNPDPNVPNTLIMYDCYRPPNGTASLTNGPRPWNTMWGAGNLMTSGAIYIFNRLNSAPFAGHIGWGIELADGSWEAGAWDNNEMADAPGVVNKGHDNGAWRHRFSGPTAEADMRCWFAIGDTGLENIYSAALSLPYDRYYKNVQAPYDRYAKFEFTGFVNTAAVFGLESQSWDWGYGLSGNNCLNEIYKILVAYGWSNLTVVTSNLSDNSGYPNTWFDLVRGNGTSYPLQPLPKACPAIIGDKPAGKARIPPLPGKQHLATAGQKRPGLLQTPGF